MKLKKKIVFVHNVLVNSNDSIDTIDANIKSYKEKYAQLTNYTNVVEIFIPTKTKEGVEQFIID